MQFQPSGNIRVYGCRYERRLEEDVFRHLSGMLPFDMQEKARAYRRWEDAHGAVLGKLLLRWALRRMGNSGDLGAILYTAERRPYIGGCPDFNVSHSGKMVVCIIGPSDGSRVGIDLEAEGDIGIADFRSQFRPDEWERIERAEKPQEAFYRMWTAKEAVVKADGRGLQLPLREVAIGEGGLAKIGEKSWFLRACDWGPGYSCHIAGESDPGAPVLEEVVAGDLLRNIPT